MFIIGLTGGIGAGKSLVCQYFSELGIDIIDADVIARQLVAANTPALAKIIEHFGPTLLLENGELDRKALRQIIFQDPQQKAWLEDLLHPLIRAKIQEKMPQSQSPYLILDIPLLLESQHDYQADRILVIDTPPALQIERVMQRDHLSEAQVKNIIQSQISRQDRLAAADDVLKNDGDLKQLKARVLALHHRYLKQAKT